MSNTRAASHCLSNLEKQLMVLESILARSQKQRICLHKWYDFTRLTGLISLQKKRQVLHCLNWVSICLQHLFAKFPLQQWVKKRWVYLVSFSDVKYILAIM